MRARSKPLAAGQSPQIPNPDATAQPQVLYLLLGTCLLTGITSNGLLILEDEHSPVLEEAKGHN